MKVCVLMSVLFIVGVLSAQYTPSGIITTSAGGTYTERLGQSPTPTPLRSVQRIFFVVPPRESPEGFTRQLFWQLIQTEKAPKHGGDMKIKAKGDCPGGYPSVIPGIVLVCTEAEADAFLFVSGDEHGGTAELRDKTTHSAIWVASRGGYIIWLPRQPDLGAPEAARRVVKQLKKDILAARKGAS